MRLCEGGNVKKPKPNSTLTLPPTLSLFVPLGLYLLEDMKIESKSRLLIKFAHYHNYLSIKTSLLDRFLILL